MTFATLKKELPFQVTMELASFQTIALHAAEACPPQCDSAPLLLTSLQTIPSTPRLRPSADFPSKHEMHDYASQWYPCDPPQKNLVP